MSSRLSVLPTDACWHRESHTSPISSPLFGMRTQSFQPVHSLYKVDSTQRIYFREHHTHYQRR